MLQKCLVAFLALFVLVGCRTEQPRTLTWRATITDAASEAPVEADIFIDDHRMSENVTSAEVPVPADGKRHTLRVAAPGYQTWELEIAAGTQPDRVLHGPVRLRLAL